MALDLQNSSSSSDSLFTQERNHSDQSTSSSSLCSWLDSELCSAHSDCDQESDDYIAELTLQMAQYMLQDFDDSITPPAEDEKQGNLNNLNAAKQGNDGSECNCGFGEIPVSEYQKKRALIDEQIRSVRAQRQREEGTVKKKEEEPANLAKQPGGDGKGEQEEAMRQQGRKKRREKKGQKAGRTDPSSRQQNGGDGSPEVLRAVFLGVPASSGTGVFLPPVGLENRAAGITSSSDLSRRKPGCSTVLMPGRVVQALQLHFDKMGPVASPFIPPAAAAVASSMPFQQGALTANVRYAFQLQQGSQSPANPPATNHHHQQLQHYQDVGLPQEWTY